MRGFLVGIKDDILSTVIYYHYSSCVLQSERFILLDEVYILQVLVLASLLVETMIFMDAVAQAIVHYHSFKKRIINRMINNTVILRNEVNNYREGDREITTDR